MSKGLQRTQHILTSGRHLIHKCDVACFGVQWVHSRTAQSLECSLQVHTVCVRYLRSSLRIASTHIFTTVVGRYQKNCFAACSGTAADTSIEMTGTSFGCWQCQVCAHSNIQRSRGSHVQPCKSCTRHWSHAHYILLLCCGHSFATHPAVLQSIPLLCGVCWGR